MAQPILWTSAWHDWETLSLDEWLHATVANFYLLHIWYECIDQRCMRYVDFFTARTDMDDNLMVKRLRRNHCIPEDCPIIPVAFIVHHSDHFFAVIFDFQRRAAHVLGRHISEDAMEVDGVDAHAWEDWNGPKLWKNIAHLHGWIALGDNTDVLISPMNWPQNGVDCGPIACSVLEQCLKYGLDEHGNLPPLKVQCGHLLRIKMLQVIAAQIKQSCSDYLVHFDTPSDEWPVAVDEVPDADIISPIQSGYHQAECLRLLRKLSVISKSCVMCKRHIELRHGRDSSKNDDTTRVGTSADEESAVEDGDIEDVGELGLGLGTALSADRKASLAGLLKANKVLSGARHRNSIPSRAIGTHLQLIPEQQHDEVVGNGDSQRSAAAMVSRRKVVDWRHGSNTRFPRPIAPVPLAAYTGKRWLQDDPTFDEYEGGPTIEMLKPPIAIEEATSFGQYGGGMQLSVGWADWVDHGYRIAPSAFHVFYQCDPIATMDHIMPIGTSDLHDATNQVPDRVSGAYSLARQGKDYGGRDSIQVNDVVIISGEELIDIAIHDPSLDDECRFGHNAFIRGYTSHGGGDGTPIYLDLERDGVPLSPDEVETSVDIDSIIWATKIFHCKGSVGIYMTPPFHAKPGIFKHNHTYVDIIIPQSEADANEHGGRTEWLSKRFPMSSIPHVCIGRISSASSTLSLYIMFPRMIHRHPLNGRSITLIPQDVLDIFWDRVLLPSIGDCTDVSWAPYLKQSLEEARYKARGAGGQSGGRGAPKIIPLSDCDFRDVQERMRHRIQEGMGELSMYGSSFFVLEGKGIKLLTKDGQRGKFAGPEEALCSNLPDLDWEYMMDRSKGELLVDVGISFTPRCSDIAVVGVWRLDALEASFGAGGYKRGDIHHHNMLSRYGALQAEMQQERAQQTHIAFRSSYNLYYEAIRTTSNQTSFASDSDAYKQSPSYMAECFHITKLLARCKDKTFGVRDEYRVSGQAARMILRNIQSKVSLCFHLATMSHTKDDCALVR